MNLTKMSQFQFQMLISFHWIEKYPTLIIMYNWKAIDFNNSKC